MFQFIIFIDKKMYDVLENQVDHIIYVDCRQIIRIIIRLTMKKKILIFGTVLYIIF
jgi:hypothetical protein